MSFGKPNYDGGKGFKKKNHFDTSDGDVVARIFPPFGSLKDKGVWHVFHSIHWGYKNSEGKHRSFESPLEEKYDKDTKTRTVLVRDAALDRLNDLKAKLEAAKAEGNVALVARLNSLVGMRGIYNVDNNQHMNVMLLDGTAGELKIRHKHFLALKAEIDRLRSEGVDPLSLEDGRFFVFHKDGKGNETNFKVTVYTETLDIPSVGKVQRPVVSKVDGSTLKRLETELFDLDNLFTALTADEVAKIVSTSDLLTGKSAACDEYFDARWKAQRNNSNTAAQAQTQQTTAPAQTTTPTTTVSAGTASGAGQNTALTSTTPLPNGSIQSEPAPATAKTPDAVFAAPAAKVQTQAQEVEQMSDDDFFKMIDAKV